MRDDIVATTAFTNEQTGVSEPNGRASLRSYKSRGFSATLGFIAVVGLGLVIGCKSSSDTEGQIRGEHEIEKVSANGALRAVDASDPLLRARIAAACNEQSGGGMARCTPEVLGLVAGCREQAGDAMASCGEEVLDLVDSIKLSAGRSTLLVELLYLMLYYYQAEERYEDGLRVVERLRVLSEENRGTELGRMQHSPYDQLRLEGDFFLAFRMYDKAESAYRSLTVSNRGRSRSDLNLFDIIHPELKLAEIAMARGNPDEAKEHYVFVISTVELVEGKDSPETLMSLLGILEPYAKVLAELGDEEERTNVLRRRGEMLEYLSSIGVDIDDL